ncbi:DUF6454 family protein [Streptomyces sp. NPDC045431]|uniref:DUF6454 family protein n=1 Tax=Streptomyces sp. NPDC045431 TaxID=3155613 RepID=UPI0033E8F4B7
MTAGGCLSTGRRPRLAENAQGEADAPLGAERGLRCVVRGDGRSVSRYGSGQSLGHRIMSLSDSAVATGVGDDSNEAVVVAVRQLTRNTPWTVAAQVPLAFPAHHPQGVTRGRDHRLYVSMAEITEATRFHDKSVDGYDRTPGRGQGHVFVTDAGGAEVGWVGVGEGTMYHPGGIDFDGESLWVPTAEYRPDSHSIVYRVDPDTLEVREAFRFDDHIGGIVRDRPSGLLHAVTWVPGGCSRSRSRASSCTGPRTGATSSTTRPV